MVEKGEEEGRKQVGTGGRRGGGEVGSGERREVGSRERREVGSRERREVSSRERVEACVEGEECVRWVRGVRGIVIEVMSSCVVFSLIARRHELYGMTTRDTRLHKHRMT